MSPTTRNRKGRGKRGDFMVIWGPNHGIQGLKQESGLPTRWDRIPLHFKVAVALSPCREVSHVLVLPDLLF
jgi:hypothetical protein